MSKPPEENGGSNRGSNGNGGRSITPDTGVRIPLGILMSCVGTIIAMTVVASFWMFGVKSDIATIRMDMDDLNQNTWTVADHRNFADELKIANPAILVPPVIKVENYANPSPHQKN